MNDAAHIIKFYFMIFAGVITSVLGGVDTSLCVLLALTAFDFILGISCALSSGSLSSKVMWRGGLKKLGIYTCIAVSVALDKVFINEEIFRTIFISYYIGVEGLSIFENLAFLNVPFPKSILKVLQQLKEKE